MKAAALLVLFVGAALAMPQRNDKDIQIVNANSENPGDGNYRFNYELSDGTRREESGQLRNLGPDVNANTVTGQISWTAPDGQLITLNYVADENGYRPVSDHLPK